ncbi:MAG: hypothetical protein C0423_03710 [Methylibium sp.]|nr:hypothetical protein [Methylibium sp.]
MKLPTLSCAQALRDGGIDAMAALDHALAQALESAPQAAHAAMKLAIGQAMSAIMEATLQPAIRSFPELNPTDARWREVVCERLAARVGPSASAS